MLKLVDLKISYGNVEAVHGISLEVPAGHIVSCVGSNGAGKSTTLRAISGLIKPHSGQILFEGEDIVRLKSYEIARLGISHAPEGRRIFREMSVFDNLSMGAYWKSSNPTLEESMERVFGYFPRLKERLSQISGTLSGGEQQMLSIGRALISGPKLLMIDEPSFGLAPIIVDEIADIILKINRAEGITVLLVEQNVQMAFTISSSTYVIENGQVVLSGPSQQIARSPKVEATYLGIG